MSPRRFNVLGALTEAAPEEDGARWASIARAIGAEHLAGNLVVVPPGVTQARYHWEASQEEWLLVLAGTPTVRTPAGERELAPDDLVCFPAGPRGAHQVVNRAGGEARIVILSDVRRPEVIVYPDEDEVRITDPGLDALLALGERAVDPAEDGSGVTGLATLALEADIEEPDGYRAPYAKVGPAIGAERLAATVILLRQREAVCPYHYELAEEEWLLVLEGTPSVRTPEGDEPLVAGDVVCFPRGPAGAHRVHNAADAPARVLIVSERKETAATIYEDSDKVGVFAPDVRHLFRRGDERDYWDGEGG